MDQKIINLYDEYTHKPLSRTEFLKRLAILTGSTAMALTILPVLEARNVQAQTLEQDDTLVTEDVSWQGDGAMMKGYLAHPKKKGKMGSVIVIHENRGLNEHIKDVCRRVAKAGYLALAPDALAPFGGTPADEDKGREMFSKIDVQKNLNNFLKGFDYIKSRPESNGKTGCVGFCWGGALTNQLAVHDPGLKAAVAYYGRQPETNDVPKY